MQTPGEPAVPDKILVEATGMAKALGDETRMRILALLENQELCACQIIEMFELANSTISRHLAVLKQAGLVQSRKSGRWIYFSWVEEPAGNAQFLQQWLSTVVSQDPQVRQDRERIREILKIDPEALCRIQNGKDCC